jgi:hypothetical protein
MHLIKTWNGAYLKLEIGFIEISVAFIAEDKKVLTKSDIRAFDIPTGEEVTEVIFGKEFVGATEENLLKAIKFAENMTKDSSIKVFDGYKDIVTNFWGLRLSETGLRDDLLVSFGDWWTSHMVVMLDDIPEGNPLFEITSSNETIEHVTIGKKKFEVFILTGDDGFNSMLFKVKDLYDIAIEDPTLEFIRET